ncbi:MAG: hypothetical protein EBR82_08370 [Caulobacteraceae bacterium]|nr:hypothetical protein [Caulobacteraceae bacterium]
MSTGGAVDFAASPWRPVVMSISRRFHHLTVPLLALVVLSLPGLAAAREADPACGPVEALTAQFMPRPDAHTVLTGTADLASASAAPDAVFPPDWLEGDWEDDAPPTDLRAAFIASRFGGDVVTTCPDLAARLGAVGVRFGDDEATKARAEAPDTTVFYAFSLPVLSADGREAMAYAHYLCGVRTCGAGVFFYLRRTDEGSWTIAGGKPAWIS